ncbi:hypothetical protein C0Q70_02906 [Pomacea canaliculata]|uniref:Uncharacterized protein n=1 Tax=Pomacea canaliculata TaxID=400727 RepID=A0A2T7PRD6_POMCA|nr:hypothetical protein C0Q70_02906 [Pomacea canaliculata]
MSIVERNQSGTARPAVDRALKMRPTPPSHLTPKIRARSMAAVAVVETGAGGASSCCEASRGSHKNSTYAVPVEGPRFGRRNSWHFQTFEAATGCGDALAGDDNNTDGKSKASLSRGAANPVGSFVQAEPDSWTSCCGGREKLAAHTLVQLQGVDNL